MAFNFNWSPLTADARFYERTRDLLTTALNKTPKPPIIVDDIIVTEFNLGSVPPDLEILEIGDLAEDRFRGIFKMCYSGDAFLTLKTRVQVRWFLYWMLFTAKIWFCTINPSSMFLCTLFAFIFSISSISLVSPALSASLAPSHSLFLRLSKEFANSLGYLQSSLFFFDSTPLDNAHFTRSEAPMGIQALHSAFPSPRFLGFTDTPTVLEASSFCDQ